MICCVVNVGQSPLPELELSGRAPSPQGAGQWRALISPTGGWLARPRRGWGPATSTAAPAMARCCRRWGEGGGQPARLAAGRQSASLPSTSQSVCRSSACPVVSGMVFPTAAIYWRPRGISNPTRILCSF